MKWELKGASHPPNSTMCPTLSSVATRGEPIRAQRARQSGWDALGWRCERLFQPPARREHQLQVKVALPRPTRHPELAALATPPVERNILRRCGLRGWGSGLVKICGEVVRAAGVHGTTCTDPRSKRIKSNQGGDPPAARNSSCTQLLWSSDISRRSLQQKTPSGAEAAQRIGKSKPKFARKRSALLHMDGQAAGPPESCERGSSSREYFL